MTAARAGEKDTDKKKGQDSKVKLKKQLYSKSKKGKRSNQFQRCVLSVLNVQCSKLNSTKVVSLSLYITLTFFFDFVIYFFDVYYSGHCYVSVTLHTQKEYKKSVISKSLL